MHRRPGGRREPHGRTGAGYQRSMGEGALWPMAVEEVRRDQWLARARHLAKLCDAMATEVMADDPECAEALRSSTARLRRIAKRMENQSLSVPATLTPASVGSLHQDDGASGPSHDLPGDAAQQG
jgi:hypothetical protein